MQAFVICAGTLLEKTADVLLLALMKNIFTSQYFKTAFNKDNDSNSP